jgi:GMP reductase
MGGLQAKDDGATRAAASRIVLDRSLPRRRRLRQRWAPKERRRFFCPARSFGGLHLGKTPMHIEHELKLDFKDVLIRPKRSTLTSRSDVDISRQFSFRHGKDSHDGIPIIAANMDSTGTFEMARALAPLGLSVALHKHYAVDEYVAFFRGLQRKSAAFYSIGMTRADEEKFGQVMQAAGDHIGYVCLDVANGYHENFATFVARIRAAWPRLVIMAGNVVTGEMTEQLILSGADIVKVGIGPGSVCTTRKMTGVGYPQLSAIIECADAAHGLGGLICADGGCTTPGDVAKAFGGGADFVMLGGMFAGHDESGGERIERDGQLYRRFYGMSSKAAMDKYSGGVAGYRAAEGKEVLLPERGPVEPTVNEILGGVRSACTYVGARRLKELTKRTTFIRVTQQLNEVFGKS